MEITKTIKLKLFSLFAFLVISVLMIPNFSQAAGMIDVDFESDPLFNVHNIYPGKEKTKDIRVTNNDTVERDLYMKIGSLTNEDFAKEISFYVSKKNRDKYYIGGEGDRFTLKRMNNKFFYVKRLAPEESINLEVKVRLKTDAGNEFQGEKTKFNVRVAFEDEIPVPVVPPLRPGQIEGGNPIGVVEGEETTKQIEEQASVNDKNEEIGGVAGEESKCQSWPKWFWILAIIVFAVVMGADERRKYYKVEYGWKFPAFWTVLAVTFWYFFDRCREYEWFLYGAIIFAIVSQFVFLHFLKKKVGKTPELKEIKDVETK